MKIYLLRHGVTIYNTEKRYQGQRDIPLSTQGRAALRRADFTPEVVYVSPMTRARQTAAVLFPDSRLVIVPGLREMDFGTFEGRNYVEMENDPDYLAWVASNCESPCPDGEKKEDFAARSCGVFARLLDQAAGISPADCPPAARAALAAGEKVYRLEVLQQADPLILEAAAHALVAPHRDPEEKYIRLLCRLVRQGSGAVQLRPGVRMRAGQGCFWQEETLPDLAGGPLEPAAFRPENGTVYPLGGGLRLCVRVEKPFFQEKTQAVHKKDLKNVADYARITMLHPALTLRSRLPGDVYRPVGRNVTKPLRKWMNEQAIPPGLRDSLPLLADGSQVVWVCGAGFAEGLAPRQGEQGIILHLEIETREGEQRGR